MELTASRAALLDCLVCQVIADSNGGRYPSTFQDWRSVARRAGIRRILFCSRELVPSPILRYDRNRTTAMLYLPIPRSRRQLYFWMLHEVGEKLMGMEVAPVFVYPEEWGDHHAIAKIVESCHAPALP